VFVEVRGVAQIVSRSKAGPVVTVAELMRRCAPAPEFDDDGAAPIPVAALLRREGRSSAGLPAVHAPAVGDILANLPARQPLLRRGAIAAGALLAAGSVFGLTAAMNAPVTPPTSSGTFPDQGDPSGPASPTVLDAGQAAPSTWLPVAFPTLFPEANASAAPQAPVQRAAAAAPAAPVQAASGGSAARQASSPATSTRSNANQQRNSSGGVVDDTVDVVGNTVGTVGNTVREVGKDTPVKEVTDKLGGAVSGVGRQLSTVTAPITAPLAPITAPLAPLTSPLTTPLTTPPTSSAATSSPSSSSTPTSSAKPSTSSAPTSVVTDLLD
jgi:hypothetical protein